MTSPGPNEEETDHGRAYARARAPFLGVRAAQRAITWVFESPRARSAPPRTSFFILTSYGNQFSLSHRDLARVIVCGVFP